METNCCYGNSHFTTCPPSWLLGFFKIFIFSKTAANFLEISRKRVFTASNRNIIKIRVEKKKMLLIGTNFVKTLQFSDYKW